MRREMEASKQKMLEEFEREKEKKSRADLSIHSRGTKENMSQSSFFRPNSSQRSNTPTPFSTRPTPPQRSVSQQRNGRPSKKNKIT